MRPDGMPLLAIGGMNMDQLENLLDRPRPYYNIDGLVELGGSVMCLGLFVAARRHWDITTPASLIGIVFAAAYAYGIARAVRWKWVVVCAMTLGSLVIAFLPAETLGTLANDSLTTHPVRAKLVGTILLSLMIYGAMLLISGGISFWLYLRHTQAPAQESQ